MAVELASAYISLVPSARGIGSRLRSELSGPLESEATNIGDRASRNFGNKFVSGMGTVATRGAVALAAGFTLAAGAGIKIAGDFEQTTIAFEGILGSSEAARDVLGDLRDFAAKTPFEFTGLTEISQQLLGVGFTAEDIIPTLSTIGDVGATLGVGTPEIKGVVRALGQIKGKGKVTAEELQQISEQVPGFSAIGALAEGLGVSIPEAFDAVSKGAVPADEGIAAILAGMEDFPGAAGAMERQSKTLNGVISNFKDTLATTAIDFITPYLPAISAGITALGGFIQTSLVPAIDSFIQFVDNDIAPAVERFIDLFNEEGIGAVLSEFGSFLGDTIRTQGPVVLAALGDLIGVIGQWVTDTGLPLLGEAIRAFVPAFVNWIGRDAIPAIVSNLPGIVAAIAEWVVVDAVPALFGLGVDMAIGLIDGLREYFSGAFALTTDIARDLVNGIIDFINKSIIDRINDLLEIHIDVPLGPDIDLNPPNLGHLPRLAHGGRVTAGMPVIVGDGGRPELFVPDRSGVVLPQVPSEIGAFGGMSAPLIGGDLVLGEATEDQFSRGIRELRWLQAVQLQVSSR